MTSQQPSQTMSLSHPLPRPSPHHRRIIFFPATSPHPEIRYLLNGDELRHYLCLTKDQKPEYQTLFTNGKRLGIPGCKIVIARRRNALYDGSCPNASIAAAAGYKTRFSWRGDLVVYVCPEREFCREPYFDVHHEDYQHALRFLTHYGTYTGSGTDFGPLSFWTFPPSHLHSLAPHRPSKATLIHCPAHAHLTTPPHRFSTMMVRRQNPAFMHCAPLPLTQKLGFPLLMRALPGDAWRPASMDIDMGMDIDVDTGMYVRGKEKQKREERERGRLRNEAARVLTLGVEDVESGKGLQGVEAGGGQSEQIYGTVVLLRQDGHDLETQHVDALLRFCAWIARERDKTQQQTQTQHPIQLVGNGWSTSVPIPLPLPTPPASSPEGVVPGFGNGITSGGSGAGNGHGYGQGTTNYLQGPTPSPSPPADGGELVTKQSFEAFWNCLVKIDPGWAAGVPSPYQAEWKAV